ncbi:hypothetical protein Scep_006269 [Stephania cephalantha]|uniref:Mitochondrial carrier protein n=1 Tax=Stephania cephalantha TaxID=152367 RepID=A0AAP0KA69_9MAGN
MTILKVTDSRNGVLSFRCFFACEALDQKLVTVGGAQLNSSDPLSWDTYDPSTNRWTCHSEPNAAPDIAESVVLDGKMYIRCLSLSPPHVCSFVYEPSSGTWKQADEDMASGWRGPAVVVDGTLYVLDQSSGTRLMKWEKESREWIAVGRLSPLLTRPPCRLAAVDKSIFIIGKGLSTVLFDVEKAGNMGGVMVSSSIAGLASVENVISYGWIACVDSHSLTQNKSLAPKGGFGGFPKTLECSVLRVFKYQRELNPPEIKSQFLLSTGSDFARFSSKLAIFASNSMNSRISKPDFFSFAYELDFTSIEYKLFSLDLGTDIGRVKDVSTANESQDVGSKQSESKSKEILTKARLVSAIGAVWDCANRPIPVFRPKGNVGDGERIDQKENLLHESQEERSNIVSVADTEFFSIGPRKVISSFGLFGSNVYNENSWKVNEIVSPEIPNYFGNTYGWISGRPNFVSRYGLLLSQSKGFKPRDIETCADENKTSQWKNSAGENSEFGANSQCKDPPIDKTMEVVENAAESVNSLGLDYFLGPVSELKAKGDVSRTCGSALCSDYHIDKSDLSNCGDIRHVSEECKGAWSRETQTTELFIDDNSKIQTYSSMKDNQNHAFIKHGHAFAGALAGTFVSICLHPIDTIKTIVQSHGHCKRSGHHVLRSIISQRGVTGMYRGISSNIASSAPISALYTFTYETVKGALLPLLPEGYQSVAHCMAGGCSSIATSFIFTPSECIKQQMQVGMHYQNSWSALLGILYKGGLPSLYTGWTAVLCRNIPHSIIKFYTYEKLKQLIQSPAELNSPPNTFQTLLCGGLAGSTAALFTTPFDVVKTRLQTQIPGSLSKYEGVLDALQEIFKHEGLKGLYRGLTPRLIMYVSQGAIFFASYEFFKSVLCLKMQRERFGERAINAFYSNYYGSSLSDNRVEYGAQQVLVADGQF